MFGLKDNKFVENLLAQVYLNLIKACLLLNQYLGALYLTHYTSYTDPASNYLVFGGQIQSKEVLIIINLGA